MPRTRNEKGSFENLLDDAINEFEQEMEEEQEEVQEEQGEDEKPVKTKQQPQKPLSLSDYINSLADLDPIELEAAKTKINAVLSSKRKEKVQESKKLVIITDFYDSRVRPFAGGIKLNGFKKQDGQAVYSITGENGETTIMNGAKIKTYFSNRIEKIKKFENKEIGPSITLEHNEQIWDINFEFYAIGNLVGENIEKLLAKA